MNQLTLPLCDRAASEKCHTIGAGFLTGLMSELGLGCVKTPASNLRVEIPSRFRQFENQKSLRPLLGEDDRVNNSAHSRLGLVFTQPGSNSDLGPRLS